MSIAVLLLGWLFGVKVAVLLFGRNRSNFFTETRTSHSLAKVVVLLAAYLIMIDSRRVSNLCR